VGSLRTLSRCVVIMGGRVNSRWLQVPELNLHPTAKTLCGKSHCTNLAGLAGSIRESRQADVMTAVVWPTTASL
jgi:hypothetical protein